MRKVIESYKVEVGVILLFVVAAILFNNNTSIARFLQKASFLALLLLYFIRMFLSLVNWKFSRGIAIIGFMLNFTLLVSAETIAVYFFGKIGFDQLLMVSNLIAEVVFVVTFIIMFNRYNKRKIYWQYLNVLLVKTVVVVIFYNILQFL